MRGLALNASPLEKILYLAIFIAIAVVMVTPYYYLAILPAILIVFLIISYSHPIYGFYAIVFLVPFGAYRNVSESELSFLKIHWILAIILTLYLLLQAFHQRRVPDAVKSRIWPFVALLFVVNFISAMLSPYPETAFHNVGLFVAGAMFILITMFFIDKDVLFKNLPAVLVISVSLSSFFGVIGYLFNISFFAENIEEGQFKRSLGGSTDPNNYALMIAFTLPFIKALVDKAKTPAQKTLYMGLLAINVLAVIFSFSRGGALIAAGLLFMMFVKHLRKQNVLLGFVQVFALILVIVVMMAVLPEKYTDHFKNILNPQADASIDRRSTYLIVGLESFYKYPILGTGLGTFRDIYAESYYARKFEKEGYTNRRFAHNTYLEYLVGTGLIGTLIFAAIIALAARNYIAARKNFLKQGDQEGVTQIETYILSFLILLVYLFIYSEPFHKYLLLSIGLSQVAYRLSLPGKK